MFLLLEDQRKLVCVVNFVLILFHVWFTRCSALFLLLEDQRKIGLCYELCFIYVINLVLTLLYLDSLDVRPCFCCWKIRERLVCAMNFVLSFYNVRFTCFCYWKSKERLVCVMNYISVLTLFGNFGYRQFLHGKYDIE